MITYTSVETTIDMLEEQVLEVVSTPHYEPDLRDMRNLYQRIKAMALNDSYSLRRDYDVIRRAYAAADALSGWLQIKLEKTSAEVLNFLR